MPPRSKKDKLSFEQALERLETITARTDAPDVGLEELIDIVEEGLTLLRDCRKQLAEAELRIQTLKNPDTAPASPAHHHPQATTEDMDHGFTLI